MKDSRFARDSSQFEELNSAQNERVLTITIYSKDGNPLWTRELKASDLR